MEPRSPIERNCFETFGGVEEGDFGFEGGEGEGGLVVGEAREVEQGAECGEQLVLDRGSNRDSGE